MFECNFTGYILKGFLLWGFLFPTKMRYSLGYKPSEVQEASTGMLIRAVLTVISSDSTAESQGCLKLPQNCSPSSPPWGSFLLKYFFIILIFFLFLSFPTSQSCLIWGTPCAGRQRPPGKQILCLAVSSSGLFLLEAEGAARELRRPWECCLPLAPSCSTFCFVLHVELDWSSHTLNQHSSTITTPLSFPAGKKGIQQCFKKITTQKLSKFLLEDALRNV